MTPGGLLPKKVVEASFTSPGAAIRREVLASRGRWKQGEIRQVCVFYVHRDRSRRLFRNLQVWA